MFEYALVIAVICCQLYFWDQTQVRIRVFNHSLPDANQFNLHQVDLLLEDLKNHNPHEILEDLEKFTQRAKSGETKSDEKAALWNQKFAEFDALGYDRRIATEKANDWISKTFEGRESVEISLIHLEGNRNELITEILTSINTYLIRNKGTAADFNLLRDIVQRNLDAVEEEINATISIPIYCGLAGTMVGIIIGLFSLPDINSSTLVSGGSINNLIGGVKIAMIASLSGLVLTIWNTGWTYKGAKMVVERQKNRFYTFLQTDLLPVLAQDVSSGITALNRNIERFGSSFSKDVAALNAIVQKNYQSLQTQQEAVKAIQNMDLVKMASFNSKVIQEIKGSMEAFERLGAYLNQVNSFVANARQLVDRSNDVGKIAGKIDAVLEESRTLQQFLLKHFTELEQRGTLINDTVGRLDNLIDKSLTDLHSHMLERINAVKELKVKEELLMEKELEKNRGYLGNLQHLETIQKNFSVYFDGNSERQQVSQATLASLHHDLQAVNQNLSDMLAHMKRNVVTDTFKRLFLKENGHSAVAVPTQPATRFRAYGNVPGAAPKVGSTSAPDGNANVFYLSTPNQDGTFVGSPMDSFDPAHAVYKFTLRGGNELEAHFAIVDHEAIIADALDHPESLLKPVCDYEGGFNDAARHIETLKPGLARRHNGVWTVQTPALIRFK